MPQKPLKPPPAMTAKKVAPNRHGKIAKTKKGGCHALYAMRLCVCVMKSIVAVRRCLDAPCNAYFWSLTHIRTLPARLSALLSGRYDKPAKRKSLKDKEAEDRELTKAINAENEARAADVAANAGGKLNVIKPPVNATKDDLKKAKRPGIPWGASSK